MTDVTTRVPTDSAVAPTTALKEWALSCRLVLDGEQLILLRKGGIDEKGFWVEAPRFFLFPTYLHQHRDRLRPEFHARFDSVLAARGPEDTVTIEGVAEVVEAVSVGDAGGLASLRDLHPYSPEHIAERLAFRPRKPPVVLIVRGRRLRSPVTVPMQERFGGCLSWVDIDLGDLDLMPAAAGEAAIADAVRRVRSLAGQAGSV